ncbi:Crp/Fnr family transcriptional regulator [Nocardiopsis sp. NRRL B-16309]|uniref:Crp/Fnr family transcriptional regulator n=1 Tax=Nocardiopsis sp. NRRL B-16309 TaxID=1519494 RepID=UPI0006AFC68E|nr:Crp/Fnr family transcriptional regulator [Nocardiopsis sp. NRRL B-16309]KOX16485.1 transcriptional regulator [Nocardiopsis sp. NRRL B-16309]
MHFDQSSAMDRALRLLGGARVDPRLQQAAWVARCVGRGSSAPLTSHDVTALASTLRRRTLPRSGVVFGAGNGGSGVWIVRSGQVELSAGSGSGRVVVQILKPGDVDGDIPLLLGMPMPYTGHALEDVELLELGPEEFERLLASHPAIARRWLSSVAERLNTSHMRILGLLGKSLAQQTAQLLLDESDADVVALPQRTLAAMLGVRRPSLNKVLKEFERAGLVRVRYAAIDLLDRSALSSRT